jgi:hypothetical protein
MLAPTKIMEEHVKNEAEVDSVEKKGVLIVLRKFSQEYKQ